MSMAMPAAAPLAAATTFPRFTSLPLEIREMIFRAALPGPRIVLLQHQQQPHHEFKSQSTVPVLDVCQNAYPIVTMGYTKAFGTAEASPKTWFNFDIDTLYLDFSLAIDECGGSNYTLEDLYNDATKVRNLALYNGPADSTAYFRSSLAYENWIAQALSFFGGIQTLTLVIKEHEDDDCGELVFLDEPDLFEHPPDHKYHPTAELEFLSAEAEFRQIRSLDLGDLECHRLTYVGDNGSPAWIIPEIEFKMAISSRRKAKYEERRRLYDEDLCGIKRKTVLSSPGSESLEL